MCQEICIKTQEVGYIIMFNYLNNKSMYTYKKCLHSEELLNK